MFTILRQRAEACCFKVTVNAVENEPISMIVWSPARMYAGGSVQKNKLCVADLYTEIFSYIRTPYTYVYRTIFHCVELFI